MSDIAVNKANIAIFNDTQSAGTNAGTFTSGAWRTRVLNTEVYNDITGCSISSNVITLQTGTYYIEASAPAYSTNRHQCRLENVDDTTTEIMGTSSYSLTTGPPVTRSLLSGTLVVSGETDYELQHRCQQTSATFGLGIGANFSEDEIFATIAIRKIA